MKTTDTSSLETTKNPAKLPEQFRSSGDQLSWAKTLTVDQVYEACSYLTVYEWSDLNNQLVQLDQV